MIVRYSVFLFLTTLSIAKANRFYFRRKAIGYQRNQGIMNSLENSTFIERGIKLVVNSEDKSQKLQEVTICFEMAMVYGLPACLFDVAGLQFFYSSPTSKPQYGHIRFTKEYDKTIYFSPETNFEPNKASRVCLVVQLNSTSERSHIKLFWDGYIILDEQSAESVSTTLSLHQNNYLGACQLSNVSKLQPLEPDGMDGWIQNFKLWRGVLTNNDLIHYTGCNKTTVAGMIAPIVTGSNVNFTGNDFNNTGSAKKIRSYDVCEGRKPNYTEPMHLKWMTPYSLTKKMCSIFGGKLSLPKNTGDLSDYEKNVTEVASSFFHVFGQSRECDKYWIPLKKNKSFGPDCWTEDLNGNVDVKETFLPFSTGEPNGGLLQKCVAVRLNGNKSTYHDQDCEQDHACSLCLIPKVNYYVLRGMNKRLAQKIDTQYYLSNEKFKPISSINYIGLKNSLIEYNQMKKSFNLRIKEDRFPSTIALNGTASEPYGIFDASVSLIGYQRTMKLKLTSVRFFIYHSFHKSICYCLIEGVLFSSVTLYLSSLVALMQPARI